MKPEKLWSETDEMNVAKLYELYQLHWMMTHGYSLDDLVDSVDEYAADADARSDLLSDWESDCGFSGSLYVCFNEFIDAELLDNQYMSELVKMSMNPDLIEWYTSFSQNQSKEDNELKVISVYTDDELVWAEIADHGRMAYFDIGKDELFFVRKEGVCPNPELPYEEYERELCNDVSLVLQERAKEGNAVDIASLPHITEANSATRELYKEVYQSAYSMYFIEHDEIEDPSAKAEFIRQVDEDILRFHLEDVIEKNSEGCLYVCYGGLASSFSVDEQRNELKQCRFEDLSYKKQPKIKTLAVR